MNKADKIAVEIATEIKQYLIKLAMDYSLPNDLTLLDETKLVEIVQRKLPTNKDYIRNEASHYLCEGEISIEDQIQLISNHENEDDFIDDVEGVMVWLPVERHFTCYEFLQMIGYSFE